MQEKELQYLLFEGNRQATLEYEYILRTSAERVADISHGKEEAHKC